ncbi:MAG: multicopper oxidase domain-containing protein [Calothrix sp. MO_167.B42]|nr:multicopper oxidase domain-containing protein [Calothrix sp. MO_167.B42]
MNHLLLFLRRTLIVFLVGTFISVSTFRGEAVADVTPTKSTFRGEAIADVTQKFVNSCTLKRANQTNQPTFQNPPFAYADTIYQNSDSQNIKDYRTITFDAVQDKFYLDGDGSASATNGYNGYLYKTTFFDNEDSSTPSLKTIVRDNDKSPSLPGKLKVVDYNEQTKEKMVGTYTPPTIVVSPSDRKGNRPNSINLELTNDLPVNVQLAGDLPPTKENLENQSQYTNIHYHGFNVSPLLGADDVLVDVPSNQTPPSLKQGGYYPSDNPDDPKYGGPITEYKMDVKIPYVHQSGLFWYHSHAHSLSDNQVRGGLSGGIIIKGGDQYYEILSPTKGIQTDDITDDDLTKDQPEKFSVRQKVMMFKDFNDVLGTKAADCFTVNGQVNPKISIRPGEVQLWRMANVGADQYMNIALEEKTNMQNPAFANPNGKPNFYILTRDADFVEKVVPTNSVLLPPASRVEVLVVGGKTPTEHSTYNLVSDLTTNLTTEDQKWVPGRNSYLLATVELDPVDLSNDNYVCYTDNTVNQLGLSKNYNEGNPGEDKYCDSNEDKDLYAYIEKQVATSQTGSGSAVDKILPAPEELFDGYYVNDNYSIPICQSRDEDFVTNKKNTGQGCLTPSNLYSDPLTKKRYFYFSQDFSQGAKFFLKGFEQAQNPNDDNFQTKIQELYDGNRIDKVSRVGDLEEWHLVNTTISAHVFHIHQLDFVVPQVILSQDPCDGLTTNETCTYNNYTVGKYQGSLDFSSGADRCTQEGNKWKCPLLPQGYRDVIHLPPNSETIVRIPFVNPFITGPFVYHCHILFHEDTGMMNNLKVENTKGYGGEEVIPLLAPIPLR